jgi:uncharacterized RDD family membrane protein YckC
LKSTQKLMARIQLETTQNVLLEFELAGVGDRIVAGLLDILFMVAYLFSCYWIFIVWLNIQSSTVLFWILLLLVVIPFSFYNLFFELYMNGQSPGKKIMKIKVIRLDGAPPRLADYLLRWFFRPLDMLFGYMVAVVCVAITPKEQRIGDLVAGTTVVRVKKRASLEDTVLQVVEYNYKPVFSGVMRFSDRDINTLKDALMAYEKTKNSKHIDLLSTKIKNILNVESSLPSARLLETVIKDFNYYSIEK